MQSHIMADHLGALKAQQEGLVKATHMKQSTTLQRRKEYCDQLEITDYYLVGWEHPHRVRLMFAFMHAFYTERFSTG